MKHIISILGIAVMVTTTATSAGSDVSFWAARDYMVASPGGVAIGDVNGDGRPDVVVTNTGSSSVTVFLTWGAVRVATVGLQPGAIAVADFNGDSHLDVAVADVRSGHIAVLLGNGDGSFAGAQYFSCGNNVSLNVADFNGDHVPDLIVWSPDALVLLGNGDGTCALRSGGYFAFATGPYCARRLVRHGAPRVPA